MSFLVIAGIVIMGLVVFGMIGLILYALKTPKQPVNKLTKAEEFKFWLKGLGR